MSNPSVAWRRLQAGNHQFHSTPRLAQNVATSGHTPAAVVFRCADADAASEVVFGQREGSLVEISNWGHVIDTGVLATAEYAVEKLKTPLIVVLGHHQCAAMQTTLDAWANVRIPHGAVRAVVEQAISSLARPDSDIGSPEELAAAHVVQSGVSLLQKSPALTKAVDHGDSAIVCLVSDADGRIRVCATFGNVADSTPRPLEYV
ncbi:carbonic anhydrase [Mycobacterium spongiae]|uniref:Carbonic anhydrase n=1 Tax=Mycobacterium spongiae TaxID=886343 RepID=A0A975K0L4_9MYCO|nr:carbonic anhydrase [Mycobacterium spongiae]QUR69165.1 hypothetical protein F6B93_20665 [Mycobacterium spongiae]